ncbi:type I CRISPR-associated protein Cas7 [Paenibacillus sp. MER TA 81-3]|uniref:type I CRISPR-associated protein Cas7 n=1 Tax=Paenibacillus sp. MER TA 81-3 TaxID=2939573 RepID=UPI0020414E2F|nr:type I CRISPR-associated protein Cas7 [Paenibacillus sp. MER TA 81-3]MCM3337624.1 type I CRISPR-associated protein Cas7 [Paenibacillus sp. MER TA 81-3]
MAKKNNRVVGLIGIVSRMANWNADFTGLPKTISNGQIFGSDKALKYSIKRYWEEEGRKVLYIRSYKLGNGKGKDVDKLQPRALDERYEDLFGEKVSSSSSEVLNRLFQCVDVMNFGATFAVKDQNIGLTGPVQIGQGFNKWDSAAVEVQDILSPFRNSNEKSVDRDATSIGKKTTVDEAHYIYPFSVNPKHYDHYTEHPGMEQFEGYTEEAYEAFKQGALIGATMQNTNSKSGAENAFALFIEFKDNVPAYMPNLDPYVKVRKDKERTVYDLTAIDPLLADVDEHIERVEIYVNPYAADIELSSPRAHFFNIFTRTAITQGNHGIAYQR